MRLGFPFLTLGLALSAAASPLTFSISGTFGPDTSSFNGPLGNGSFSGWFTESGSLPISPPNTGTSYIYLPSFDIFLKNSLGQTVVEFNSANSGADLSAVYESANGGDFLQFYDQHNDQFILYFNAGFNGVGSVIPETTKGYVSDALIGGFAAADTDNVVRGSSLAPESSTLWMSLIGAGAVICGRRRLSGAVRYRT